MEKDRANDMLNGETVQLQKNFTESLPGSSSSTGSSSGAATAFIFIAVVLSLAAGGISFILFQKLESTRSELTLQQEHTRNNLAQISLKVDGKLSSQLNNVTDKLAHILSEQKQFQNQVTQQQKVTELLSNDLALSNQQMLQSIEVLFKQKGSDRIGWVLAEVEYLLLIANHSLHLQKNVGTAIIALKAADSRLLNTGDPGTIKTRTQIRDDIQKLNNLKQPDIIGMAVKLSNIIKSTPDLPIKFTQVNTQEKIHSLIEKEASHDAKSLEQASKDFLRELRKLVIIRKLHETPKPLMTPEQHFFFQQNFQLKLETARHALLSGQQSLFSSTLTEASQWLEDFFDREVASVQKTLSELKTLKTTQITTTTADISGSLKALRSYQKELEKQQEVKQ